MKKIVFVELKMPFFNCFNTLFEIKHLLVTSKCFISYNDFNKRLLQRIYMELRDKQETHEIRQNKLKAISHIRLHSVVFWNDIFLVRLVEAHLSVRAFDQIAADSDELAEPYDEHDHENQTEDLNWTDAVPDDSDELSVNVVPRLSVDRAIDERVNGGLRYQVDVFLVWIVQVTAQHEHWSGPKHCVYVRGQVKDVGFLEAVNNMGHELVIFRRHEEIVGYSERVQRVIQHHRFVAFLMVEFIHTTFAHYIQIGVYPTHVVNN